MGSKVEALDTATPVNTAHLRERLFELLRIKSPAAHALLDTLCHLSDLRQGGLYVVGGVVRDLLLDQPVNESDHLDLDLAFNGHQAPLRHALSEAAGKRATIHHRFGTASARLSDGTSVDLARTRSERYPSPATLPIVAPASIDIDLQRRDFTINAMALALTGDRAGALIDPHGGVADLKRGVIRTLHAGAFRDDPTRLIRAARYAARIGSVIERRTMIDARRDRHHLQALSPARFGDAWRLLLQERSASSALELARRLKISQSRDARWTVPKAAVAASGNVERFWASVGILSPQPTIKEWLPQSVGANRQERAALEAGVRLRLARRSIGRMRRASRVALSLKQFPDCALEAAELTWSGASQAAVSSFLARRSSVVSPLNPERLMELGVEPSRRLGAWLEQIESAIWDGELDPSDALSVARMEQRIRLSR